MKRKRAVVWRKFCRSLVIFALRWWLAGIDHYYSCSRSSHFISRHVYFAFSQPTPQRKLSEGYEASLRRLPVFSVENHVCLLSFFTMDMTWSLEWVFETIIHCNKRIFWIFDTVFWAKVSLGILKSFVADLVHRFLPLEKTHSQVYEVSNQGNNTLMSNITFSTLHILQRLVYCVYIFYVFILWIVSICGRPIKGKLTGILRNLANITDIRNSCKLHCTYKHIGPRPYGNSQQASFIYRYLQKWDMN